MAREQGLALNPSRLAGMCGRLKCCLRYEYATYVELRKGLPAAGKRVRSVKGDGKVLRQNIFKQTVLIQRDDDAGVVEAALEDLVAARPPEQRPSDRN
jgi:cell fate regulator YaaT (PSP1 superfamily)